MKPSPQPSAQPSRRSSHSARHRIGSVLTATAATALLLTSCGSTSGSGSGSASGGAGSGSSGSASASGSGGTLTVLAASSLTGAFTTLSHQFEKDHPGTTVRLAFDSSATLAEQVQQGAPADVLATADTETMQTVVSSGDTLGKPANFASNEVALAVPAKNPAGITRFSDLNNPGVAFVVCVATAPCGKLALSQLKANKITAKPKSEEIDVKSVLTKVEAGEADAGIVYRTDVVAAGSQVTGVSIPTAGRDITDYPIAALKQSADPGLAKEWVSLVRSAAGQRVLAKAGFGKP